jgi:hypothetical protein
VGLVNNGKLKGKIAVGIALPEMVRIIIPGFGA